MNNPIYELQLHKSYFDKGFFNLGVSVDRFVRNDNGPINLYLGPARSTLTARVDRNANQNGTPRIMGGAELRAWFHRNFEQNDKVAVEVLSPTELWLGRQD